MKHDWSVRVRTESPQKVTASARNHSWRIGEPISFAPKDEHPSAVEMAVAALGADLIGGLQRLCKLRRIDFDRAEISLRWTLENPLVYVGVIGEHGSPAIDEIEGVLYVSCFEEDSLREAWEEVLRRSPLLNTFQKAATVKLRLNVTP